jgi:hypothetical protein
MVGCLCANLTGLHFRGGGAMKKPTAHWSQLRAELEAQAKGRELERRAQKLLGIELIDIGFKRLARQLHPDVGGSHEDMARLNRARKRLTDFA